MVKAKECLIKLKMDFFLAERALDTMNFDPLRNRPMRIMWSQRDPALRKSGVGNVFIKNLDKNIDNKSLYDTFSAFGNILSCKIMTDDSGQSKGFGFVHFETQAAADEAIKRVNDMLLADKKVFVGPFIPQTLRLGSTSSRKFTNLFVKNFGDQLDNDKFRELFEPYGTITSALVRIQKRKKIIVYDLSQFRLCMMSMVNRKVLASAITINLNQRKQ